MVSLLEKCERSPITENKRWEISNLLLSFILFVTIDLGIDFNRKISKSVDCFNDIGINCMIPQYLKPYTYENDNTS